jgi:quinoprotein glucose dehydrogenase
MKWATRFFARVRAAIPRPDRASALVFGAGLAAVTVLHIASMVVQGRATPPTPAQAVGPAPAASASSRSWRDYGGGPDSSKFVALNQITMDNVAKMTTAWTYPAGDTLNYQFNPIVVDDVMYVLAKNNSLVALNAATGEEIWIHANLRGIARRGVNYWESADRKDRRLLFQMNNYLQAIDARTGKSILTFGNNGLVDLKEGLGREGSTVRAQSSTPGKIFQNLILLGSAVGEGYLSPPGHLRAFDVVTGKLAWIFHTVPQPGEFGYDTWPKDAYKYVGGANTWGEISIDEKRGIAYFPTGSPTYDYYGADRLGSNLFANCLLALDARTGKRLWHYQVVHHDLWDYDLTAAPQLITVRRNGRTIDAVAQASKQGFMFVFDRVTGEPVFPIEERPVPKSEMPGEEAWPTQPFPTAPPPFARQIMTENDITPYFLSPEDRATWTERLKKARKGLFNPPSTDETVAVPGAVGGANWGNTAANPAAGLVYVMSQDFPSFYKLTTEPGGFGGVPPGGRGGAAGGGRGQQAASAAARGKESYALYCESCHGGDHAGVAGAGAPAISGIGTRMAYQDFRQILLAGRGRMPSFPTLDEATIGALYTIVGGNPGAGAGRGAGAPDVRPAGPVVASGGAPGGLDLPSGGRGSTAYPEGVDAPKVRYYTGYGLGNPHIMTAPWSRLVAYDLNAGTIKWQVPLGVDRLAAEQGGADAGVPRGSQRMGMIVTSTGLLFATAKDGKVRAYSAEDGKVLWTGELPQGAEGLPAMYEAGGRQFLVVCATTGLTWGPKSREGGTWTQGDAGTGKAGGYVVFALPQGTK